mgnify:CR=1 FL=1
MLTQEYLKTRLNYNKDTGIFTWVNLSVNNQVKVGTIAGYKSGKGYLYLQLDNKSYSLHRLAWFYIYGNWPNGDIGHINGNPLDNRLNNLRDVTTRDNCNNRKLHRLGKLVGAHYVKYNNKWKSRIQVNGKTIQIGTFNTQEEAHKAYLLKRKELEL